MKNAMPSQAGARVSVEQEELRGVSRTVAEIEWLLLILTLLYQVVEGPTEVNRDPITIALGVYAAFVLGFHYANFYRSESRWKVAIETWVMLAFITWVVWFTGKLQSPLVNLYLLPIITSALALGKLTTLLEAGLITSCYVLLRDVSADAQVGSLAYLSALLAQVAPILLVAYITTMFSADIRYGMSKAKLLSETDELTSLYNMRGFSIMADKLFGQALRYARPLSVLMIDSDNLKHINDKHGHDAGNNLLRQTAQCIKGELRGTDVLARYGGDEFVALLPDTGAHGAREVAERIRKSVSFAPLELGEVDVPMSVSIGIATFPDHGRSIDTILKRADSAMYEAKTQGRNNVASFALESAA